MGLLIHTPPTQIPAFEVASIRQSLPGSVRTAAPISTSGGRFVGTQVTLKMMLQFCYRPVDGRTLRNADVVGGPAWVSVDAFDVQAKAEDALAITEEQMRVMVQSLLADRFRLKIHWESRETDVYQLVVAPSGPKIKASDQRTPGGLTRVMSIPSPAGLMLSLSATAITARGLANELTPYADRPIVSLKTSNRI